MIIEHLFKVTEKEKSEAIAKLFKHSVPSKDFFFDGFTFDFNGNIRIVG